MERTLYVTNFSLMVEKPLLYELFLQMGPVYDVTIKANPESNQPPYAFVEFEDEESVIYASKMMDGIRVFGQNLVVKPLTGSNKAHCWHRMKTKILKLNKGLIEPEAGYKANTSSKIKKNRRGSGIDLPSKSSPEVKVDPRFTASSTTVKKIKNQGILTSMAPPSSPSVPLENPTLTDATIDAAIASLINRIAAIAHERGESIPAVPQIKQ